MDGFLESLRKKFGIGEYPVEYNPRVHGPYHPSRYYGKPDTKFTQVKLGELSQWLGRRNYDPVSMIRCASRGMDYSSWLGAFPVIGLHWLKGWWRWQTKWLLPRKASIAPVIQICLGLSLFFYINQYPRFRQLGHHHTKYHW